MNKKISVIIPVYNSENYIEKCLYSVLYQSYENKEVIIINDGSTDKTLSILEKIKDKYDNIVLINQENQGQSIARNVGLEIATGDYIAFLDSDDYIHEEMYTKLITLIESSNVDFACSLTKPSNKDKINETKEFNIYNRSEIIHSLANNNKVRYEVWNKVFKKETLYNIYFRPNSLYEEVEFLNKILKEEIKAVVLDEVLHYYTVDRPGNTNSYFNESKLDGVNRFTDFFNNPLNNEEDKNEILRSKLQFIISLYLQVVRFGFPIHEKKLIKEYRLTYNQITNRKKINKRLFLFNYFPKLYSRLSFRKSSKE